MGFKLLFDCLDVDRKRDGEDRKRGLRLEEVAFLDSWTVEPTIEDLDAEDAANAPPRPKATLEDRQLTRETTARLTSPKAPSRGGMFCALPQTGSLPDLRPRTMH